MFFVKHVTISQLIWYDTIYQITSSIYELIHIYTINACICVCDISSASVRVCYDMLFVPSSSLSGISLSNVLMCNSV